MAIIKCKMCGGDIQLAEDKTFGTCEYCGSTMTLPKVSDDQRAAAFNRGNHFRRIGEFDKALAVYERIVTEDDADAEAHWCCALCRFGIEYVEDPATYEWLPTCHRASFDSFLEDVDYLAAVEHSDGITRRQYQKDAAKIAEVQRGILATSQNTEPYDVFISYKELDADGNRTRDSILAQELYYRLTENGWRVFFSRISLEDVPGTQYEPYIFAALNSAKVMIVVGTSAENLNAVWVKNEWSRYLSLMRKDRSKLLIPCYRDMDPYDLPEQLAVLMSYDMGKIGFIQDLIRGVDKVLSAEKPKETKKETVKETVIVESAANIAPLLKRAFIFLEDGNFSGADEYCERVLDQDPENAQAYLGKLMAEQHVRRQGELADCEQPFDRSNNYQKAVRYGDEALSAALKGYIAHINERNENARITSSYDRAVNTMNNSKTEAAYKAAADIFKTIPQYKDADALLEQCLEKAEICRKDAIYSSAKSNMTGEKTGGYETAIEAFRTIIGWKDADEQIVDCQRIITEIKEKEKAEAEFKRIAAEKAAKKRKKIIAITAPIVVASIAFVIVLTTVIIPKNQYAKTLEKIRYLFKDASVGDVVVFGEYEQDGESSNGKEGIEWLLLEKDNDRVLVISRYALECLQYNSANTSVTWETCSLREWLNSTFLREAFNAGEREFIPAVIVSADENPNFRTSPGNSTTDKVFLLSTTEANRYFATDIARQCQGTAYCIAQSVNKEIDGRCWWWLRSPGSNSSNAAGVGILGAVSFRGCNVDCEYNAIRPAMWIEIGG